ncbi:MAG: tetraacyldisaccharide 4'-kinase [Candidatus Gastranaerophilales bacterium]|nr:tetraacyldisaccharide 4'-kinase [Candidatus Gastranaerophilales bacterium]
MVGCIYAPKNMGFKVNISKIHYNKQAKGLFFSILKFCSFFYAIGSRLKNSLYDKNILTPKKVDAFVISVGNLTTGGVGKTPVVAEIANYLTQKGEKVAIVSRGYGSGLSKEGWAFRPNTINLISDGEKIFFDADMAGDEPVWLAKNTKAVVITCKNRYGGSKYAIEKFGVTKIILDDGFQHRKLHRDLDIVLVDSEKAFGNEKLLPAGPLREGAQAFDRVDKIVIVSKNTEHTRAEKYAKIMNKKLSKETFVCYMEPDFVYNVFKPEERLSKGEKILAFSAIGQPQQFYNFLKDYDVLKTVDFDDHHNYTQADIDKLVGCINAPVSLITTEKDASKLLNFDFKGKKVFALKLKTRLDVERLI